LTFANLLSQVRTTTVDAYSHQDIPFDMVVHSLRLERRSGHLPLINTAFGYHLNTNRNLILPKLDITSSFISGDIARFDLVLNLFAENTRFHGYVEYRSDLFNTSTINNLINMFKTILNFTLDSANLEFYLSEIPINNH
ncbi:hypothetical protein KTI57_18415, partial [Acinetobacter pittii]|uniref:condensation domain-containing protein n=1 Tax=Acinetobacter pittii TaxID=48296 RepID=UPI0021D0F3BF